MCMFFVPFAILWVFCVRVGSPSTWICFSNNDETKVLPSYSTVRVMNFFNFDDFRVVTTSIFRVLNKFVIFVKINLPQRFTTRKCQISTKKHVFSFVPIEKSCDKSWKSHLQLITTYYFKSVKTLLLPSYPYITNLETHKIGTFLKTWDSFPKAVRC